MTLEEAIRTALPLVRTKTKHKHYDHVVKLAEKTYRPMITGENTDHLLQQFNLREDAEAFEQRKRLTELITPAITNTLTSPVRKVPKVKPIVDVLTFGDQQKEKDDKLKAAASVFYSGKSVDHWFASIALDQGMIDPNAWALILFDDFGGRIPEAKPYPSIISSTDAWNYERWNGQTIWLLVHRDIKYTVRQEPENSRKKKAATEAGKVSPEDVREESGDAFWFYSAEFNIVLRQIDPATVSNELPDRITERNGKVVTDFMNGVTLNESGKYFYRVSKTELYEVGFYQHKSGEVQSFVLGYVPDQRTKGETYVNLWHAAVPFLMKGIKAGSELDLSAALHAFLQKLTYREPCMGYKHPNGSTTECNGGYEPGGTHICKGCGGLGYQVHKSGQDHISLRMPRSKDEMLPLTELVHYVTLPVDVLKWQDEYVDKLEDSCYRSVYNSDRFKAEQVSTTATGDIINLQSVYDAVRPFCEWYSQSRNKTHRLLASYVVGPGSQTSLKVHHELPRNLRFETISERVKLLTDLGTANATEDIISAVEDDLIQDIYIDDPGGLLRTRTHAVFNPFKGKKEATIVSLIAQDLAPQEHKVYWTNRNFIWEEAEARVAEKKAENGEPLNIYDLTRAKQKEVIDAIVNELIEALDAEAEANMPIPGEPPTGEEEETGAGGTGPGETGDGGKMPDSPGKNVTE